MDSFRAVHPSNTTPTTADGLQHGSSPQGQPSLSRTSGQPKRLGNALMSPAERADPTPRVDVASATAVVVVVDTGNQTDAVGVNEDAAPGRSAQLPSEQNSNTQGRLSLQANPIMIAEASTQTDAAGSQSANDDDVISDLRRELLQARQLLANASQQNQRYLHDLRLYAQYTQRFLEERQENAICIQGLQDELARYEEAVPRAQEMLLRFLRNQHRHHSPDRERK